MCHTCRDSPKATKLDKQSALEIRDGSDISMRFDAWVYNVQPDHADRQWVAPKNGVFKLPLQLEQVK